MGAIELIIGLVCAGLVVAALAIVAHEGNEGIRRSLDETYCDGGDE